MSTAAGSASTSPGVAASPTGRIVVGIDGSKPSRVALAWAQSLAATTGSTLQAVAVWQAAPAFGLVVTWDPAQLTRDGLQRTLDDVLGERKPAGLITTVEQGNTAQVLLEASTGARMLVVGSRGHGGFTGLLLGSVSAACAEHATCPVLVIHGDTPPPPLTKAIS